MKKSTYVIAAAASFALTLAACGEAPEETTPGDDETTAEETEGEGETEDVDFLACLISDQGGWDDQSFNQSAMEGLLQAVDELGVREADAESQSSADFTNNVEAMVQQGCDLTIGVGFLLEQPIQDGADANPELHFGLVDSSFSDDEFNPVELENAKPILFNTAEAAFLAGYLSAGVSETGVVATFGGMQLPSVQVFMDGFADGVDAYNEAHDESVSLLGWDKETQAGAFSGDFEDQAQGQALTEQFIAQGADIVMPVAGPVGLGAAAAAESAGDVLIIGVDSDWTLTTEYGDIVLTSVLKQIGPAVFDTIAESVEGNFSSEPYVGTLENEGVGLAEYGAVDVPAELSAEIDELAEQIISGDLVIESPNAP